MPNTVSTRFLISTERSRNVAKDLDRSIHSAVGVAITTIITPDLPTVSELQLTMTKKLL